MIYIGNAFSINMIQQHEALLKIEMIDKTTFRDKIRMIDKYPQGVKSIIGHPEIAKTFNAPLNRESITLSYTDVLFIVVPSHRPYENQIIENGHKYEFIPESEGYSYYRVEILNPPTQEAADGMEIRN